MSEKRTEKESNPEQIRESLGEVVEKLDQTESSSASWGKTVYGDRERWERLKKEIAKRQKALKTLVMEKKAGSISQEEFNEKFRILQDELAELEFEIYNLRLGTQISVKE